MRTTSHSFRTFSHHPQIFSPRTASFLASCKHPHFHDPSPTLPPLLLQPPFSPSLPYLCSALALPTHRFPCFAPHRSPEANLHASCSFQDHYKLFCRPCSGRHLFLINFSDQASTPQTLPGKPQPPTSLPHPPSRDQRSPSHQGQRAPTPTPPVKNQASFCRHRSAFAQTEPHQPDQASHQEASSPSFLPSHQLPTSSPTQQSSGPQQAHTPAARPHSSSAGRASLRRSLEAFPLDITFGLLMSKFDPATQTKHQEDHLKLHS